MKVALIEAFFTGSHKRWAEVLQHFSLCQIDIFSLKGNYWKWRMHGGAISLAYQFLEIGEEYDLILATDMMDLALFKSLISEKYNDTPIALYFHENQFAYPKSGRESESSLGSSSIPSPLPSKNIFGTLPQLPQL